MTLIGSTITSEQVGQSNSPSENYLFLNVMVNFVIVNQKMTGSALHIEKNQTIHVTNKDYTSKYQLFCIYMYMLLKNCSSMQFAAQSTVTVCHAVSGNSAIMKTCPNNIHRALKLSKLKKNH